MEKQETEDGEFMMGLFNARLVGWKHPLMIWADSPESAKKHIRSRYQGKFMMCLEEVAYMKSDDFRALARYAEKHGMN
jgi:hypothetical protein